MIENWKVGSTLKLIIKRSNGTTEDYGYIHNTLGVVPFSTNRFGPFTGSSIQCFALSANPAALSGTRGRVELPGTFRYVASTGRIERVSGNYNFTAAYDNTSLRDLLVFSTGEKGYVSSVVNLSAVSVVMKDPDTDVSETTCVKYRTGQIGFGRANEKANPRRAQQSSTASGRVVTYSNGVTNYEANTITFPVVSVPYTLDCITVMAPHSNYIGNTCGAFYDIPTPIYLSAGDAIILNDLTFRSTWDSYTPRAITGSALSGTPFNYTYLRLLRVTQDTPFLAVPNRIWLIKEANALTVPAGMLSPTDALITPSSISATQTIFTVTQNTSNADYTNFGTEIRSLYGTLTATDTFKQIAWGSTAQNQVYGIITFETPQVITAGKVIHVGQWTRMEVDLA